MNIFKDAFTINLETLSETQDKLIRLVMFSNLSLRAAGCYSVIY